MTTVYGIGNPLMDIMMSADGSLIAELGATPGSMNLVEADVQRRVIERGAEEQAVPGGSCANTMRGIAFLGGANIRVVYGGAVGADELGERLTAHLQSAGVESRLAKVDADTGSSAILVTPDHERTMFTHLGACRSFGSADVDLDILRQASLLHLAGYMWDTENQREAATVACAEARAHGIPVSFDIADPFVVERYRDDLCAFLPGAVDLLFGNLAELRRLTDLDGTPEEVAKAASRFAPLVALKIGADGCVVYERETDTMHRVPAAAARPVDTTGAGDAFAAGFLVEYVNGADAHRAAVTANALAAAIVEQTGCRFETLDRKKFLGGSS